MKRLFKALVKIDLVLIVVSFIGVSTVNNTPSADPCARFLNKVTDLGGAAYFKCQDVHGTGGLQSASSTFWSNAFQVTLVSLGLLVILYVVGGILWHFDRNLKVAVAPIPSIAEINNQLIAEGYQPTLQDCLAVEEHLKSERNEAAVTAGVIFAGLKLGAYQSRGGKIL
jgi:hypothetical protein